MEIHCVVFFLNVKCLMFKVFGGKIENSKIMVKESHIFINRGQCVSK